MQVLVTGAAGFIGQHVVTALHNKGHMVIGLDVYHPPFCDKWVEADIREPLKPMPGLDAVIHLAAIAAPNECDKDPARAFVVNVAGTQHVLQMAWKSGAKKVVFSSSAHVYDIPPRYTPTDEMHPLRLNNTYTTTKLLGEQLCHLYFENYGLSYITLRLFNAYGPGQRLGYFLPDQLQKAKSGRIELRGGSTTKDWVYVEDVARAFVMAAESQFVGAVNIGTGRQTHLHEIAAQIAEAYGAEFLESVSGVLPTFMCADIGRARRVLGWEPTTTLEEGLRAVVADAKVTA